MLLKIALLSVVGVAQSAVAAEAAPASHPSEHVITAHMVEDAPTQARSSASVMPASSSAPAASASSSPSSGPSSSTSATVDRGSSTGFWPSWFGKEPHLGVSLDAGVPDGLSANAIFRPWYFVRASAGYANNGISNGVKGSLTFVPFNFFITPAVQFEAGHFFNGDGALMRRFGVELPEELRNNLSYTYYTGNVGLEMGSQKRFIFSIRGGLSRVNAKVGGLERMLQDASGSATLQADDGRVRAGIPSVKLGFAVFFL